MPDSLDETLQKKLQLRRSMAARRETQGEADVLSRRIGHQRGMGRFLIDPQHLFVFDLRRNGRNLLGRVAEG
jgi:hypothetical protein